MQKRKALGKIFTGLVLILTAVLMAAPTSDTNIVKSKDQIQAIEQTTLPKTDPLFDGVVSSKEDFSVGASNKTDQNVIIQLKHPYYLRELRVFMDKTENCSRLIVRYSRNTNFWFELTDIRKEETAGSLLYDVNGENVLANYVAFVFVADPTKPSMRIQELEIYPQMDIRLKPRHIKDNWQNTDREVFDDIDTKIDTVRNWKFSEVGAPLDKRFKSVPAPILEGELLSAGGLKPGTAYEYLMTVTDYNGNILELEPRRFSTLPESFAFQKSTEGTFDTYYDGSKIPAGTYPLTDGSTDINRGMAMSGSVKNADQAVIVDLGAEKPISEVVSIWRELGYSKDFAIQLSSDKNKWTTVAEHQNADTVTPARSVEGHPVKVVFSKFDRTPARYIKLLALKGSDYYSKHGTGVLELFELKAF